jgi:D-serine deaminase-like pyridoxal phosphate-dependent protein
MHLTEIDTPALLVDLDIMQRNLRRVATYAREHGLRLRPHTKTHKSPLVGRWQLESGAVGLTVAKVGEAEVMLGSSTQDLLVAYPVIGRAKLDRLMEVASRTRVTVALDSAFAARQLSDAARAAGVSVGVLAEVDVGLGRVGVSPGEPLLALAMCIDRLPHLDFEGITFYPGHIRDVDEPGREALHQLDQLVRSILADFLNKGLEIRIVSGGSTPTLFLSHEVHGLTEIRPGTYVYNDLNTVRSGGCAMEDCAARVAVTVVSTSRPGQIIIDGGSKTFSSDRLGSSSESTFGYLVEAPAAKFHKMNEEHGYVDVSRVDREFSVGDRVHVVPNHICVAVNLHEQVYGIRGDRVEQIWKVEGRGKLQ